MKKSSIIVTTLSVFLLTGCGKQVETTEAPQVTNTGVVSTYIIGSGQQSQEQRYGVVVADTIRTITNNVGGVLEYLDCQPGAKVTADTVIARLSPNDDDPTIQNLRLQQASLEQQLANMQASYELTEQNFEFQRQSLESQAENNQNVYDQDSADLEKLENTIANFKSQQENSILDAFKKVRNLGGRAEDSNLYDDLYDERDDITDMDDDEFSQYLEDMAELMKKAASYASGDANYSMFMGLANTFRSSKSSFDSLTDSYASAQNAYNNQHDTLGMNLDLVDEQIQTIENNKQIQLNALDTQMQTIQQNLDALSNTLGGEEITADVNGVVKMKGAMQGNKLAPSTMICQISPSDAKNVKIQILSSTPIKLGRKVQISQGGVFLGTGVVRYELPYKDPTTQNYIYELPNTIGKLKEGDRLVVSFVQDLSSKDVWIPLEYVIAKLGGNYVKHRVGTDFVETPVQLGNINASLVQVMSGLILGEEIGK